MNFKIAVLPGDGIGPEIIDQAKKVITAVGKKFNHNFNFTNGLVGAIAIDKTGNPLPSDTDRRRRETWTAMWLPGARQSLPFPP